MAFSIMNLQGIKVCLRPLRPEDSDALYRWINDRELVLLSSSFHPVTRKDHGAWFESTLGGRPDLRFFVIQSVATGKAIGTCKLLGIDMTHRCAELQIRIGEKECQGKGLGSEAVSLLVNHGFRELDLHRIYLRVFETNDRAIRAYEKCGFKREGLLREAAFIDGAWVDIIVMGQLAQHG